MNLISKLLSKYKSKRHCPEVSVDTIVKMGHPSYFPKIMFEHFRLFYTIDYCDQMWLLIWANLCCERLAIPI